MKRLLSGTALLTVLAPMAAFAAGSTPMAPPTAGSSPSASRVQVSPSAEDSQPLIQNTNGAAVLSAQALSARYLRGAAVVDPKGNKLGSIDDIVFDSTGRAELAVVAAGGVVGLGARNVGINFGDLTFNNQSPKSPSVQISATPDQLNSRAVFDGTKLPAGQVLASDILGASAKPMDSDKASAKLTDIIMDKQGISRYAAIEYGGIAGVGGKRVAVDYSKLTRVQKGQAIPLTVRMADLQSAPPFIYEPDDTTASIPSTLNSVTAPLSNSSNGSSSNSDNGNSSGSAH